MAGDDEDRRIWKDGDPRGGAFPKDQLAAILKSRGISKAEFARTMGVSRAAVYAWIDGKDRMTNSHLLKAAYILDVPITYLLSPTLSHRHFDLSFGDKFANADGKRPYTSTWADLMRGKCEKEPPSEMRDPNNLCEDLCKGIIGAVADIKASFPYDYDEGPHEGWYYSVPSEALDALEHAYKLTRKAADHAASLHGEVYGTSDGK